MTGEVIAFFVLAIVAIMGGMLLLHLSNVVHMVVALVFTFLAIAGIFITLSAEFVAAVQVLIYSGAVTIIMLFGIMLTRHDDVSEKKQIKSSTLLAAGGVGAFFLLMFFAINGMSVSEPATNLHVDNTKRIGELLYTNYLIPFELISVLLLAALIGAIILAKRDDKQEEKP
ncbi:NADH:ubiquinone oxidoreductase subunit J [Fictibacillus macauensis ZFHKF-1]|uniref:NADH-quinone oxidoreductase subunit J n=1 Tax=Fictibacillus macauensis ZFHKF-1 TaxID=1196324 RepID=I8UA07_9BACL|nr:NADH-quinone oxidoreductase subunit J [Fictibacillus macauensis]EIT83785.1 NADH:ubiquinone oxidoreductase subunit J [Fictibacillus macauensis ZFHKF-1]